MLIERNSAGNFVALEQIKVTLDGKLYRVTASPKVSVDRHPLVEVLRPETMHGVGDRVRFAHWARVVSRKRRDAVRAAALQHKG